MLQIDTQQSIAYWQFYWIEGGEGLCLYGHLWQKESSLAVQAL